MSEQSVAVRFHATAPFRREREPVSVGLPWPKGWIWKDSHFHLIAPDGESDLLQSKVLDRWSDGSIRWCLFDFFASGASNSRIGVAEREVATERPPERSSFPKIDFDNPDVALTVQGMHRSVAELTLALGEPDQSERRIPVAFRVTEVENGSVRMRIHVSSCTPLPDGLECFGFLDFFSGMSTVRMHLTLRNTKPCAHPGGTWDLGNAGSAYIREFTFSVRSSAESGPLQTRFSIERDQPFAVEKGPFDLFQASSGGESWNHHNHLDRNREVPLEFRGYRVATGAGSLAGLRATPAVCRIAGDQCLAVAAPRFWENFPKRIRSDENGIAIELFPRREGAPHELLGGEQKTCDFFVAFEADGNSEAPLDWCRNPLLSHADPEWYAFTGAIPRLLPAKEDDNAAYLALVDQAIEGPNSFFEKREAIDEYGWRNFGDVYADHEAVFHKGSERLVSHYNNQFDVVNGCALQFLRSADRRWWELLIPAADHTCDIDTYHTTRDKGAYNGGLFPFTFHYVDADTSAHRGYPRMLQHAETVTFGRDLDALGATGEALKRAIARGLGGGPSASHTYNQGLMLAHFLTGDPRYREAAIGQAEYIIRIDQPSRLLRLLSSEYGGGATPSGSSDYHGPGRASGNSILALLVGHQLTGQREFLEKAEQVIRRVSHPKQDLEKLDLLNAELRWFYVMHLQALGAYLDHKAELGELDQPYAYARFTLLHFARWMVRNERPFLSKKEELQYPTETWPAQDMRKVEAFQFAAQHSDDANERSLFLERAEWFFREIERSLSEFPTKSLCRPVNLLMNFGASHSWWQKYPDTTAPLPSADLSVDDLGEWEMFVPQRRKVIQRIKLLAAASGVIFVLALAVLIAFFQS